MLILRLNQTAKNTHAPPRGDNSGRQQIKGTGEHTQKQGRDQFRG